MNDWADHLKEIAASLARNQGPDGLILVTGSAADSNFWARRFRATAAVTLNAGREIPIHPIAEHAPLGNFLGTLNALIGIPGLVRDAHDRGDLLLLSMLFGKGTRLSPFTQALGNRKTALPMPRRLDGDGTYLTISELANLTVSRPLGFLREHGFEGLIVKWGDEALIPGRPWTESEGRLLAQADVVRFVTRTAPTPELANQKEWLVRDAGTQWLTKEYTRQAYTELRARIDRENAPNSEVYVNLGSFAIGYEFLACLLEVFEQELARPKTSINWDPYFWIALFAKDRADWEEEGRREAAVGQRGIASLEERFPDFFARVKEAQRRAEARLGRPLRIGALDFGDVFWIDMGSHREMRSHYGTLLERNERGAIARLLYGIPEERDGSQNIVVRSHLPPGAKIENSILLDTRIGEVPTAIRNAIVVGGEFDSLDAPAGGVALFSAAKSLVLESKDCISFRSVGAQIRLAQGERHTTVVMPDGQPAHFRSFEHIEDYSGRNYREPILDNPVSFERAGELLSSFEPETLAARWSALRSRVG